MTTQISDGSQADLRDLNLTDRVVQIKRVSKVVKGGRRFSFSAVVVVGDGAGYVGVGIGKANEVPEAIRKGGQIARKELFKVHLAGTSLPHPVLAQFRAARVMMKPASPGTGVIAGGAVRAVVEAAGIHDVLTKSLGSSNPINVVKAAIAGLRQLHDPKAARIRRLRAAGRLSPESSQG